MAEEAKRRAEIARYAPNLKNHLFHICIFFPLHDTTSRWLFPNPLRMVVFQYASFLSFVLGLYLLQVEGTTHLERPC